VSYVATTHSRASRHYNRQASNNSMASRASLSASACGSYASGSAVSSSRTGRLGRESSYVSSSSGHTLRSHRAGSVTGGSTRRKGGKKCVVRAARCSVQHSLSVGRPQIECARCVVLQEEAAQAQAGARDARVCRVWRPGGLGQSDAAQACAGEHHTGVHAA
jgi:hypothetical protein